MDSVDDISNSTNTESILCIQKFVSTEHILLRENTFRVNIIETCPTEWHFVSIKLILLRPNTFCENKTVSWSAEWHFVNRIGVPHKALRSCCDVYNFIPLHKYQPPAYNKN